MNLLYVIPSFAPAYYFGGPARISLSICKTLQTNGVDVRVLTTNAAGNRTKLSIAPDKATNFQGILVRYSNVLVGEDVSLSFAVHLVKDLKWADVVHLNSVFSYHVPLSLLACRAFGKPLVWSPRGALQRANVEIGMYKKLWWLRAFQTVMPPRLNMNYGSEAERNESNWAFPDVEDSVVPHGVTIRDFPHTPNVSHPLRLLYFGRIHAIKGLPMILKAVEIVNRGGSVRVFLTVAGDGDPEYTGELLRLADELQLRDSIRFVGPINGDREIETMWASHDVSISCSERESFGGSIAESLGAGVPVIVTDNLPWQEVQNQGCGLVANRDISSVAAAIDQATSVPLREMGVRGKKWVSKEFSWASCADRLKNVYSLVQRSD